MNPVKTFDAFLYQYRMNNDSQVFERKDDEHEFEIFIPSHHVVLNSKGILFRADEPRNMNRLNSDNVEFPLISIQISQEFVNQIKLKLESETC